MEEIMKKYVILLMGASFFFAGCGTCPKQLKTVDEMVTCASNNVKIIKPEELHELMNSEDIYTLIDVRERSEYYHGYIPGALVLPRGVIEFKIANEKFWEDEGLYMPQKDEKIILYCKKGGRSILAAESLLKLGYQNVEALEGGFIKWELTYPDEMEKDLEMLMGGGEKESADTGGC